MERSISPPRVHRRGTGTTRYEKEIAGAPKLADDPNERKWVGPWLMGETIGKGASGRVRLGRHKRTGKLAAIKIVPKIHLGSSRMDRKSEKVMQSIRREMVVMKLIHHPHVMDMYDVYEDDNELYLLLEYIEGGELFDYLVSKGKLDPNEALSYFKQIISGVDYCHKFNICHRDLKPENLLLDGNKNIKIADFGMAALELDDGKAFLETSCGSPHYASPEIVAGKAYHGAASDIWSCGVVLFALLTGRLPFDHENMAELLKRVKAGKFEMPSGIPAAARDLLSQMLIVDPARRIPMSGIISHPFFNLEFTTRFPVLAPPPFYTIAQTIESEHLIDRQILDNLTTLFRGLPQREIIKALLSETKTWEKAFYHLLKEYHERQSEEYGHGMSFVDFSSKDDLQVISSSGRYQSLDEYGPTSTIKGRDQSAAIPIPPKPHSRSANVNNSSERTDNEKRSIVAPVATRAAPSPALSARRHRSAMVGPRPHSIAGSPTESLDRTVSGTSAATHRALNSTTTLARPALVDTSIQEGKTEASIVVPHVHPVGKSPPTRIPSLSLAQATTHSHSNHSTTATDGNDGSSPRTLTNVSSSASPPSPATPYPPSPRVDQKIEHRLLEQRLRNANVMRSSCPPSIDRRSSGIGLGLTLPTVAKQPIISPPVTSTSEKRASIKLAVPAGPRTQPPSASPRPASPEILLTMANKLVEDKQTARTSAARRHKSESRQSRARTDHVKHNSLAVPTTDVSPGLAIYPSPPPSQASSLEPFLALHQSPVFADRFSLHLDAMLPEFRPSMMPDVENIPDDGDEADRRDIEEVKRASIRIVGEHKGDESSGTVESSDWEVIRNDEKHPVPSSGYKSHKRVSSNNGRPLPQVPIETRQTVRTSTVDHTSNVVLASDVGNVGSLSKHSHTVPASGVSEKENLESPVQTRDAISSPHGSPADRIARKQRPVPLDSVKLKKLSRMSTFVAAPPSPIPTPVLEPIGLSWFAQLFNVKPAAYVFHSQDSYIKTRDECATLLRSFGVSVVEVDSSNRHGLLKCHIDYIQEVSGKMIINKGITFRAQITPHFSTSSSVPSPRLDIRTPIPMHKSPMLPFSEACTLSLIQERGAKSTLEVVALRLRQEWRLDSLRSAEPLMSPLMSPRFPVRN